ncbi:MAG: helix-turn-helix transcriptional regulator [Caldilineaceae bacterium]
MAKKREPDLGRNLEETKRTARILQIVQMIAAAPKRYLRKALAEHFAVSDTMIKFDLEVIRHGLRLPLARTTEGYYFEGMPQLPALQYPFTEALALLTSVQAAQQVSGVGSAELAAAIARLEALFPTEFLPLLKKMTKPPVLTAQREHRQQMLTLLNRALLLHQKVRITYETRSRDGAISERVVHPYQIMPYVRSWQLIAYCERRQEVIMFKIDRIHEATVQPGTSYTIAPDFDPEEYIGNRWGIMRVQGEPEDVVLHFDAEVGRRVAEESWHKSQQTEILPDDSVIFRLHMIITPEFVSWLLYYGSGLEVIAPQWLRERVAAEHEKSTQIYHKERSK